MQEHMGLHWRPGSSWVTARFYSSAAEVTDNVGRYATHRDRWLYVTIFGAASAVFMALALASMG